MGQFGSISEDHMIHGFSNIRCNIQKCLPFWAIFGLSAPWQLGKSKFWNWKKTLRDIIILHISSINDNHMIYGSWDMEHDKQNFLSFWTVFYPYGPRKLIFWKNDKNTWRYYFIHFILYFIHFTNLYHEWQSYDVWFLRYRV